MQPLPSYSLPLDNVIMTSVATTLDSLVALVS